MKRFFPKENPIVPTCNCRFCNDEEFARRHVLEDEALLGVANAAAELLGGAPTSAYGLGAKGLALKEALTKFRNLDSDVAEVERTIKALEKTELELEFRVTHVASLKDITET